MLSFSGNYIDLREININDAAFVLSLRCDSKKSRYLNTTDNDLKKQEDYIRRYETLDKEWYFIIENKTGKRLGTYRIYDVRKESFCIGSWLMIDGCKIEEVIEGDYMLRMFGFKQTKLDKIHFDVRKDNKKVINYHKLVGGKIVSENDIDCFFICSKTDYLNKIKLFMNDIWQK